MTTRKCPAEPAPPPRAPHSARPPVPVLQLEPLAESHRRGPEQLIGLGRVAPLSHLVEIRDQARDVSQALAPRQPGDQSGLPGLHSADAEAWMAALGPPPQWPGLHRLLPDLGDGDTPELRPARPGGGDHGQEPAAAPLLRRRGPRQDGGGVLRRREGSWTPAVRARARGNRVARCARNFSSMRANQRLSSNAVVADT